MNKILFTKMHGLGNDYIFIDMIKNKYPFLVEEKLPKVARYFSKFHFGIGGDGIILIDSSDRADFKMRIFNSDGSEAEMCGNGIRCFAKYIYDNKMTVKNKVSIETLCGIKEVEFIKNRNGVVEQYKVNMGIPKIEGVIRLNILNQPFIINKVSIGNPHAVIFVKDVDRVNTERYGPLIENNSNFPNKTNVEFVQVLDRNLIKMRVWERGSKETYAFVSILAEHDSMDVLPDIVNLYKDIVDDYNNIVRVRIITAYAIDDKTIKDIIQTVKCFSNNEISYETVVDESIIGGIIVYIGSTVYDYSIKNQIGLLQNKFTYGNNQTL